MTVALTISAADGATHQVVLADPVVHSSAPPLFKWKNSGGSSSSALSASVAAGGSIAQGDLLLVMLDQGGGVVTPPDSTWHIVGAPNNGSNAVVYWKIAGASEPLSYTFKWASSGIYDWAIASWSGISGTPIGTTKQSQGTGGPYTAPSVTPPGSSDLLLCLWDIEVGGTYTPPSGMTTRLSVVGAGTTYMGISELQLTSSSATATKSTSGGSGGAPYWATTIALSPSGAVSQAPSAPVVSSASFTVAANPTLSEFIGNISATNSPTSFAITAGDPNNNFAITSSGVLSTAKTGFPPVAGNYSLSVTATNAVSTSAPAIVSVMVSAASGTFPTAATTGVPSGTTLTPVTNFSPAANTTYTALSINGGFDITVNNVKFVNCVIYETNNSAQQVVRVDGSGITFQNCEIYGPPSPSVGNNMAIWVYQGSNVIIDHCNIHQIAHCVQISNRPVTITNSYMWNLLDNSGSHNEHVYFGGDGGSGELMIRGNTFVNDLTQTATIFIENYFGSYSNVVIDSNLLQMTNSGSVYNISISSNATSDPVSNVSITNNAMINAGGSDYIRVVGPFTPVDTGNYDYTTNAPVS